MVVGGWWLVVGVWRLMGAGGWRLAVRVGVRGCMGAWVRACAGGEATDAGPLLLPPSLPRLPPPQSLTDPGPGAAHWTF